MQERAVRLQEVSATRAPVQLAPRAPAGMAVGAEVAQPSPPLIVTTCMGAEVHRSVDCTRTSVRRRHRFGGPWRRGRGMVSRVSTRGTGRFLRQALEGCGLVGAFALARRWYRFDWGLRCQRASAWPEGM